MADCGLIDTNATPTITVTEPIDGSTVVGQVDIKSSASDAEDVPDELTIEWRIDDSAWSPASFDS